MFMSQEKLQTMSMQNFGGVKEVHYGIVQVVNVILSYLHLMYYIPFYTLSCLFPYEPLISGYLPFTRFVAL